MLQPLSTPAQASSVLLDAGAAPPPRLFHRSELAAAIARELMSIGGQRGMLLSGPRQTGKSTFVQWDLVPALVAQHAAHVVYIDLSADSEVDPGVAIIQALQEAVRRFDGLVMRVARGLGLTNIRLGGLDMDVAQAQSTHSKRALGLLEALARAAKRPVVIVLDEVQLCQQSEPANRLLVSLTRSAARLTREGEFLVRVLATGSHAHKLRAFVASKQGAFHGAKVRPLPQLDQAFVDWVRWQLPERCRPSAGLMTQGFETLLRRPQELLDACDELNAMAIRTQAAACEVFQLLVEQRAAEGRHDLVVKLRAMAGIDLALARVMAETGVRFAPHQPWCRQRLAALIDLMHLPQERPLSAEDIEGALDRLAQKEVIWRGLGFAFEEPRFATWILEMDLATDFEVEFDEVPTRVGERAGVTAPALMS